jgi:iron complex transport system substrate-binding protein
MPDSNQTLRNRLKCTHPFALVLLAGLLTLTKNFGNAFANERSVELAAANPKDALGREVSVTTPPKRIASASLASDEVVLEILRRAGQLERLVAVSKFADEPKWSNVSPSKDLARVSGEPESILKTRPDLVLIAGFNRPELLGALERSKITTWVVGPHNSLSDILSNIVLMGDLLHAPEAAESIRKDMLATLEKARRLIPQAVRSRPQNGPTVLSWSADGTVMGRHTTFDSMIRAAGGVNLAAKMGLEGWPRLGAEHLARLKPDWIVVGGNPADKKVIGARLKAQPGWSSMPAVQKERLIIIPEAQLLALSHHSAQAVLALSEGLNMNQTLASGADLKAP